nr:hypothetical protein [Tanacetum cinerariifolium]
MKPTQALELIQNMVDHSQKWHDGASNRRTSNGNFDKITAITSKLDSLRRNMKKLNEIIHAIHVGIMEMEPDIENMTLNEYIEVGAEKLRQIGEEKVQNGCNVDTSRDTNHESGNLLNFPIFPATNEFSSICEQDVDLEKEGVEVEDDDDGDTYDI